MIEEYKGNGLVAFIDLLGFSSEIINRWEEQDEASHPLQRLKKIGQFIEKSLTPEFYHKFTNYNRELLHEQSYGKVITISDSFTILIPLEIEEKPDEILTKILSMSGSLYELWRTCIDEGFTIRVGIDYGDIYWSNLNVVGPAFINSYQIETYIANTSRVVFSNRVKELIRMVRQSINTEFEEYLNMWFDLDFDGHLILNPITMYGYDNQINIDRGLQLLREIRNRSPISKHYKYTDLIHRLENQVVPKENFNKFDNCKFMFR